MHEIIMTAGGGGVGVPFVVGGLIYHVFKKNVEKR
jgi:hypothetical protein